MTAGVEQRTRERLRGAALALGFLVTGCGKVSPTDAAASASAAASAKAPSGAGTNDRSSALRNAEHRRASGEVTAADVSHAEVEVRVRAARALARIADAQSAELLLPALADGDAEVLAWSAYGLGETCRGREATHVRALAARAAALLVEAARRPSPGKTPEPSAESPAEHARRALFDPLAAVADALGRCGGADAERTLRAWVRSETPLAEPAGLAFGTLASRNERLEDASLVALLDAAGRPQAPVASALQAFTRLAQLDDTVRARLRTVSLGALSVTGLRRALAVRALAAAGPTAAGDLAGVVCSSSFTPAERADAVRGLARLAPEGQQALGDALGTLADEVLGSKDGILGASYGVLSAAVSALEAPDRAGPALSRLAALGVEETPALRRRQVALRCAAAAVLAGHGSESAVLARCDPDPKGRSGRLALLRVLGRGLLRGQRARIYRELAAADDAVVREHALELVATHPELEGSGELVAAALHRKTAGDVATAARLVADHPGRVAAGAGMPDADAAVVKALGKALTAFARSPSIEVRAALDDAAGAVALLSAKPGLEADCRSDNPTLRAHAERALQKLGNREQRCIAFQPSTAAPRELDSIDFNLTQVDVETDTGTVSLELWPTLAPVAATRLVELAREGFFDGIGVHRVVPGFVVQLGDRDGDGYGGVERPPLRCETSPAAFEAGSVGIALSGRDTGSSQFFVTLAREPHLDGQYALVGRAGPGWEKLAEGDIVRKVTVVPRVIR
jgi:cyclophilin family peptidyl-prolyl cis-trans isomerase